MSIVAQGDEVENGSNETLTAWRLATQKAMTMIARGSPMT